MMMGRRRGRGLSSRDMMGLAVPGICFVFLAGRAVPASAQATECPPAARLQGAPSLTEKVAAFLEARGVSTRLQAGCSGVVAALRLVDGRIEVQVFDDSGRRDSRVVSDISTAATVIESWSRSDLVLPLLEPPGSLEHSPERPLEQPPGHPEEDDREPGASQQAQEAADDKGAPSPPFSAGVRAGVSVADDGSVWGEVTLVGCARLGPVCAGVAVRGSVDPGVFGDSAELSTERGGVSVLTTGEYPLSLGRVSLSPGIGLGAGWMRSVSEGEGGERGGDTVDIDSGGLLLESYLRALVPLSDRLALDAGVSLGLAPMAHTSPFVDDGVVLAGNPLWQARMSAGVRFGAK